jgi:transposase
VRRKPIACTRCCRSANRKLGAALLSGEQDAAALAKLARGRLRAKRPALRQALAGRVTAQHRVLLRHILTFLDFFDGQLEQLTAAPSGPRPLSLTPSPSCRRFPEWRSPRPAPSSLQIGTEMSRFRSAAHLASWAGVCPRNQQSGGQRLSEHTPHGNGWLRAVWGEVAWASSHTSGNDLSAQCHRLARRRGKQKAVLAVAHSVLVMLSHLLRDHRP